MLREAIMSVRVASYKDIIRCARLSMDACPSQEELVDAYLRLDLVGQQVTVITSEFHEEGTLLKIDNTHLTIQAKGNISHYYSQYSFLYNEYLLAYFSII